MQAVVSLSFFISNNRGYHWLIMLKKVFGGLLTGLLWGLGTRLEVKPPRTKQCSEPAWWGNACSLCGPTKPKHHCIPQFLHQELLFAIIVKPTSLLLPSPQIRCLNPHYHQQKMETSLRACSLPNETVMRIYQTGGVQVTHLLSGIKGGWKF